MSVGVRVTCDEPGCDEHFDAPETLLQPRRGASMATAFGRCATLVFAAPFVILPPGWSAFGGPRSGLHVTCAAHVAQAAYPQGYGARSVHGPDAEPAR